MTGNRGGWGACIGAVLRIGAPGGVIRVRPAPVSRTSGKYPGPDGRAICVITAGCAQRRIVATGWSTGPEAALPAGIGAVGA
jgi:hypothetical protein